MAITFKQKGDFNNTEKYLRRLKDQQYRAILEKYGREGVQLLRSATPKDTTLTSERWNFQIEKTPKGFKIFWTNDNIVDGIPIVILIQYGHGTRSGTFVEGIDFINPVMKPLFEKISDNLWKEVTSL